MTISRSKFAFRIIYYNYPDVDVSSPLEQIIALREERLIVGEVSALELFAIRGAGAITSRPLIMGRNHERRAYSAYFIIYFRTSGTVIYSVGRPSWQTSGGASCASLRQPDARANFREELIYALTERRLPSIGIASWRLRYGRFPMRVTHAWMRVSCSLRDSL